MKQLRRKHYNGATLMMWDDQRMNVCKERSNPVIQKNFWYKNSYKPIRIDIITSPSDQTEWKSTTEDLGLT